MTPAANLAKQDARASSGRMSATDRRSGARQKAFFAVEIDAGARKHRVGVTRDATARSLLIASPSRFDVGDALDLRVLVPNRGMVAVHARVTRVEQNGAESPELWRYRLAVELDDERPELLARAS